MIDYGANSSDFMSANGDPGDEDCGPLSLSMDLCGNYVLYVCWMILKNVTEVFCEHLEDILLRHADDTLSGLPSQNTCSEPRTMEDWRSNCKEILCQICFT